MIFKSPVLTFRINWILLFVICFSITSCSLDGYEYSIIEDNEYCLLKGEFYNHNPFIKIKAYEPSSFLIKKSENHISTSKDIKSTLSYDKITDGYIVEAPNKVEIRLVQQTPPQAPYRQYLAEENGSYELKQRKKVQNLMKYLEKEESEIFKALH